MGLPSPAVDWCLDANVGDVGALRHEMRHYLRRHGSPDSDIHGAELVFSELVTNAVLHAGGMVWISVDWSEDMPTLTVQDLGPDFELDPVNPPPTSGSGRGLFIVSNLVAELDRAAKAGGGNRVVARLPVHRAAADSYRARRTRATRSLPVAAEADEGGWFGRDAFLRALVVQMAECVELEQGPSVLEAVVSQVGADVGGRMEEEFRRVRGLEGPLSPEQLAELYVGLKRAIGGDFYPIEVGPERIVLGNRACPFGEVVTRAPGLCRMTSSVFGHAAADAVGRATVVLEERIAVGDPECRVTVWLRPPRHDGTAHDYEALGGTGDEPDGDRPRS